MGVGDGFPNTSLVLVEHGYNVKLAIAKAFGLTSKKLTKQPASYLKLAEVSKADILQAQYEPTKLSFQYSLP